MQSLENPQSDQIFTMSVADYQQGRGGLADTIRQWSYSAPDGGMAKW